MLEHFGRLLDETLPGFQIEVKISDFKPAIVDAVKKTSPGTKKAAGSTLNRLTITFSKVKFAVKMHMINF